MSSFAEKRAATMTPPERLAAVFDARREQLQDVIPRLPSLSVDRVKQMAAIAYRSPGSAIAECSPDSVFMAVRDAIAIGLDPLTAALGHAWLVPYKGKAAFQIGYKGYLELGHRSGRITRIAPGAVYQDELPTFECDPGAGVLRHPWRAGVNREPENLVAAYCAVHIDNSPLPMICIMDRNEVELRRMRNPAERKGKHSPWKTDYAAMAMKCPIRALFARGVVPLSIEHQSSVADAVRTDAIIDGEIIEEVEATVLDDAGDLEPETSP